ncbi:D-arabinose 1-dehydrogenase [Aureococcus anophagefferens]|nr:D-arabinose 1-dehydrogenase [Aureococcus anophagefferens]
MGAAASAQFGPTLDAEAMKPADGSDLVDYNAARAEAVHLRRFLAALRQQVANDGVTAAFEHRDDQGAWHRYAPSRACSSPWPSARTPTAPRSCPGPSRSAGDFATSRKMATAPDTGMVQVLPTAACRGIAAAIANAPDGGTVVIPNTPTEIRWGHAARTAAHPDVPSTGVIAVNLRDDSSVVVRGEWGPYGRPVVPGPASYGMGQPAARPMPGYGQPMQPGYGAAPGGFHRAPSRAPAGSPTSSAGSPRCAAGRPRAPGQPKPQQQQQQQQGGNGSSTATNAAVAFGAVGVAAAAGAGGVLAVQNADQISAGVNDAGQWVSGGGVGQAAGAAGQWTVGAANGVSARDEPGRPGHRQRGGHGGSVDRRDAVGAAAGMDAGQWGASAAGDVGQWGAGAAQDVGQWGAGAGGAAANFGGDAASWGAGAAVDVGQWSAGAAGTVGGVAGDAAGAVGSGAGSIAPGVGAHLQPP